MADHRQNSRTRVLAAGNTLATNAKSAGTRTRAAHGWIDRMARAYERYVHRSVGRQASVVTYVAYFLAFPLLVVYLLIIEAALRASPRANEVLARILELDTSTDFADLVSTTSESSADAFIGFVGAAGVILAAAATASNLRAGMTAIFGITSPRRSFLTAPALDFSAGLWLALILLTSWVLALASLTRRRVVTDVVGPSVPLITVPLIKFGSIALALLVIALAMRHYLRRIRRTLSSRCLWIGALAISVFVVASNYAFLYFLVATLADPRGGGGFALAIVLLLWVSVVVRGTMFISCWIAVEDGVPDSGTTEESSTSATEGSATREGPPDDQRE